MLVALAVPLLCAVMVAAPLALLSWRDRRRERVLVMASHVRAAVARSQGGESFVTVRVVRTGPWRGGSIVVSAPRAMLIETPWTPVLRSVPARYRLVVRVA